MAFFETDSAVICAAKAVLFLEPLNPFTPADDQVITSFLLFVIQIRVLLNVAFICIMPLENFRLTLIEVLSNFFLKI